MKFLIFAASHRPDSINRKLAQLAASHLAQTAQIDFAEYGAFDMPVYNDTQETTPVTRSFADRAAKADGIVIATPEYNWSYPGSLKNIIDWTSRIPANTLAGKTALLLSASTGNRGGIIGLHHLKSPLESLQIFVFPKVFPLGDSLTAFDENGHLRDAKQQQNLAAILNDYIIFTQKLSN